jgi:hypothetical protein
MLNFLALGLGGVALIGTIIAFFALLGWLNWFFLPIAVAGLACGVISKNNRGRNLNIAILVVGSLRLMLGGGVF